MKALQEQLKNVLSGFKKFFPKPGYEKDVLQPSRDWQYILLAFAVCLVLVIAYGSYVYVNVLNGGFWNSESLTQSATLNNINQKNLDTVTTYFNQKTLNFKDAQDGVQTVPDPSL